MTRTIATLLTLLAGSSLHAQQPAALPSAMALPEAARVATAVFCGSLFDPASAAFRKNMLVTIQGERIAAVAPAPSAPPGAVDLSAETCLPGLIDAHTHVLLQGDLTSADYDVQLLKQSPAFRSILASRSVRLGLGYGFTTIRDVETEGAGYADVDVKRAIEEGIIPGPRMRVATRALDVTGAYPLLGYAPGLDLPHGVQIVDGPEEMRKAVREQISYGADWIKLYVDRGYRVEPSGILNDIPTFTPEEIAAAVDEAHRERKFVAAHAMGLQGVHNAVTAGVDSIEHGAYIAPDDLRTMVAKGIYYVPTIYVAESVAAGRAAAGAPVWLDIVKIHQDTFHRAVAAGVKIAFGTDVGGFAWTTDPAVEFPLMVRDGMSPARALRSATLDAAQLLRMDADVGSVEPGKYADLVALHGDPIADISRLQSIDFVMKGGVIYKQSHFPPSSH